MHTDSSARRTCRLSRSASLNTATVAMSSSRQARITRSAISPRLAISTFLNKAGSPGTRGGGTRCALALAGVDRLPGAVRRAGDAFELERQLVRVVAVAERLFFRD